METKDNAKRIHLFKKALFAILLFLFLAVLLQIAGFCTPGWVVTSLDVGPVEQKMQRGLWYFLFCLDEDCDTKPFGDIDDYPYFKFHEDGLVEYQVEATFALVAIILALAFLVAAYNASDFFMKHMLMILMAVSALVSGALAITAVSRLGKEMIDADDRLGDASPFDAPYSLILTGVGGVIACVVFLIFLFAVLCCKPKMDTTASKTKLRYLHQPHQQAPPAQLDVQQVRYVEKPRAPSSINRQYEYPAMPPQERVTYVEKPRAPSSINRQYEYPAMPPQERVTYVEKPRAPSSINRQYETQERVIYLDQHGAPSNTYHHSQHSYPASVSRSVRREATEYDEVQSFEPVHVKLQFMNDNNSTANTSSYRY